MPLACRTQRLIIANRIRGASFTRTLPVHFSVQTKGGHQYALILVDDHTRYKAVYMLRAKSEAPAAVRAFIASFTALLNRN
eukprot:4611107-Pleurochrysis_carterae.AAC.1